MVDRIQSYTKLIHSHEEFEKDTKTFDACLMDFIVIGELVWKLSDEFQVKIIILNGIRSARSEILQHINISVFSRKRFGKLFKLKFPSCGYIWRKLLGNNFVFSTYINGRVSKVCLSKQEYNQPLPAGFAVRRCNACGLQTP